MKPIVALAVTVFDTMLCAASLNAHNHGDMHRSMMLFALAVATSIGAAMYIMTESHEGD